MWRLSGILSGVLALLICTPVWGASPEPSRVVRISVPGFVDGLYELEIVLFHQSGKIHHGYAVIPTRDNLIHRIDVVPSRPVKWVDEEGKPLEIPLAIRGNYSYHNPDFIAMRERYAEGKIRILHPVEVPPLAWDGSRLTGTLDVEVTAVDASRGGRSQLGRTHRVELKLSGTPLSGEVTTWEYRMDRDDDSFGGDSPRRKLPARAVWEDSYWKPRPGTELAKGHDWPGSTGPFQTESARDHAGALVSNLHDARLVWVAEDLMPSGSGTTRGNFSMRTFAWTGFASDVFSSPAVSNNMVFLYTSQPGVEHLAHHPVVDENNVFYRLGVKPGVWGAHVDVVSAYDARTGKRVWRFVGGGAKSASRGKSTNGITPLIVGDRVIVRGAAALYAFEAATGKLLWKQSQINRMDLTLNGTHTSSVDASPAYIGGTIVLPVGREGDLLGLSPEDGSLRWRAERVIAHNQVPSRVVLKGKEWILAVGGSPGKNEPHAAHLIDPADGKIAWRSTETAENVGNVIVHGDMLLANARRVALNEQRYAGFRITEKGLTKVWENDQMHRMGGRQIPVGHRGFFYADSRQTGFWCVDMKDGRLVNRHRLIPELTHDSHNWSWALAGNDRVITSGVLMFSTAEHGFKLLPGRLSVDNKGGYVCPSKPAFVDGRLFLRTNNELICYDLRALPDAQVEVALMEANGLMADGRAMDLRLRSVKDGHRSLAVRFPLRHGPEALSLNNWVAHVRRTLDWKATPISHLPWTDKGLHGEAMVTVGWHTERWSLALDRNGSKLQGSVTRSATPLAEPWEVRGNVGGRRVSAQGDQRVFELELQTAISREHPSDKPAALYIVLVTEADRIVRAWASSGQVSGNNHEVDPSGLKLEGGKLVGTLTVLFHDDLSVNIHPENALLAARYQVDAQLGAAGVSGTHTGQIGVDWTRTVKLEGTLERETLEAVQAIASGMPGGSEAGAADDNEAEAE